MFRLIFFNSILVAGTLLFHSAGLAQKVAIKFASLAPEGSTWLKIMREFDVELREKTQGEVGFKIYGGGVLGDEMDVLRKIRIGQLHAAGFTGLGLGEIAPEIRILDTPFLFRNEREVDFIYEKFTDYFSEIFSKNGYELLGWAEVGFVHIFTKDQYKNLHDMKNVKMWVWQGDPVAEAAFKVLDVKRIPLSVMDVMTALQTNMVDGVYTSPLAAVALQWFTKVNYMCPIPLTHACGAILISKKMFDKIPEQYQKILTALSQKYLTRLTQLSRKDNDLAITTMEENGLQITESPDDATLHNYQQLGESVRIQLVNTFYPKELLDHINTALMEFRTKNHEQ